MNRYRSVKSVLNASGGGLSQLREQAARLTRLERHVRSRIEPAVAEHCRVAGLRDGELVVQVDSSAWAARLRYLAPQLVKQLASGPKPLPVSRLRVTVRPRPEPISRRRPVNRSEAAARVVEATAEGTEDGPLKQALKRLASRIR